MSTEAGTPICGNCWGSFTEDDMPHICLPVGVAPTPRASAETEESSE